MIAAFFIIVTLFATILVNIYKLHKKIARLEEIHDLDKIHNDIRYRFMSNELDMLRNDQRFHEKE